MRFDRVNLLEASVKAYENHRKVWENKQREIDAKEAGMEADWVEKYGDLWRGFSRQITATLRKGKPITRDMLPGADERGYSAAGGFTPRNRSEYHEPQDLRVLIIALQLIQDETVSASGLRELGVPSSTLRAALATMAQMGTEAA